MIAVIDNFDSFTYNIVEHLEAAGESVQVYRNNAVSVQELAALPLTALIISPGPGVPDDAGISLEAVVYFTGKIPILGICLGHQVIVQAFGGKITASARILHGKIDDIDHDGRGLFRNIRSAIQAARYHSLAADPAAVPEQLEITSWSEQDHTIMGVRHSTHTVEGLQFHPESIGTPLGSKLLDNFLHYKREASPVVEILKKSARGEDLRNSESREIMDEITSGELTDSQLGAFLGSMSVKGITSQELSAFAEVLREKTGVTQRIPGLLDTCGTGGDAKGTFNFSSAAALCCAAAGIPTAKHGNKAISSKSGSFDFLKELGIPVDRSIEQSAEDLADRHFAFLFAPRYHQTMRFAAKVRQELHMRTLFNLLGPLVNPLSPDYQVAGIYDPEILDVYAGAVSLLGIKHALILHSRDGLDELSVCAPTEMREVTGGEIRSITFDPSEIPFPRYSMEHLQGRNARENVELFQEIISGRDDTVSLRAVRDGICLNAGAGLYTAGSAESIIAGYHTCLEMIKDGRTASYLQTLRSLQ